MKLPSFSDYARVMLYLTPSVGADNTTLLQWIAQRTLLWGKAEEVITFQQFLVTGIIDGSKGTIIAGPIASSRSTLKRRLRELEHLRFIDVRTFKGRRMYKTLFPPAYIRASSNIFSYRMHD